MIKLPGANRLIYLHLSRIDVPLGQKVLAGDKLGLSGSTGTAKPHLHIELRTNYNGKLAMGGDSCGGECSTTQVSEKTVDPATVLNFGLPTIVLGAAPIVTTVIHPKAELSGNGHLPQGDRSVRIVAPRLPAGMYKIEVYSDVKSRKEIVAFASELAKVADGIRSEESNHVTSTDVKVRVAGDGARFLFSVTMPSTGCWAMILSRDFLKDVNDLSVYGPGTLLVWGVNRDGYGPPTTNWPKLARVRDCR